jgi:hypothetical protein
MSQKKETALIKTSNPKALCYQSAGEPTISKEEIDRSLAKEDNPKALCYQSAREPTIPKEEIDRSTW